MKKYILDLEVRENRRLRADYSLLKLRSAAPLPEMAPGQFAEVRVDGSATTFLRRPISICYVDGAAGELWLLIRHAGDGTRRMAEYRAGDVMNLILPLGRGFSIPPAPPGRQLLLVGGGAGVAPLLFLGDALRRAGHEPAFLLGARSDDGLLLLDDFRRLGTVCVTTEDGSAGETGFVTHHSVLTRRFERIYACGPRPMMVAVAEYAASAGVACEVSLENVMACGIGACLCCVEMTAAGRHVCVCTEGPVFDINQLTWLN
ncbi:MAG: dihydroorotate dehydrogenase electron transfer subunit [Tannerella sp.]|jgi:dihydroorotate dehydrogenase electron transfer subunit|nr:dihydroorotate dehydrogenase electron transfer subunit [Tannerella sp.]